MLLPLLRLYLRPYRRDLWLVAAFQLVQSVATLYLPRLFADIVDRGVVVGDVGYIVRTGAVMLAVTLVQIVAAGVAVYVAARAAMGLGRDLRGAVFGQVQEFAAREVGRFGAASLITRSANDVQQVQMVVLMTLTVMIAAPFTLVGGVVLALQEDVQLSGMLLVVVPVLVVSVGLVISRMRPLFRLTQTRLDRINSVLREQILGVRVIRAFVKDRHEQERFAVANTDLYDVSVRIGRLTSLMFPIVMLVMNVSTAAVLWFGGPRVADGAMQIGALTAFQTYLIQIVMSVMMATFLFMLVPRAEVSAERITEVLTTEPSVHAPQRPVVPAPRTGEVELAAATFSYPGAEEPVLRSVDLVARPGETTAIIGSTGAGKSTLLQLIARLVDVTDGAVRVDGVDVREQDPAGLWSGIGLVPQEAFLFGGTVASNLRYGREDATDEQLWEALEIAQARGFVEEMPEGLEAPIAQGGSNVSGGQRQRLAIARAVLKRPSLYLFDDCFSALDYDTDVRVRRALRPITRHATVVLVAQRVNTIRDADRIVVLDEGVVVGTGTHAELMAGCPTYREIVLSQLSAEEAA